MSLNRSEMFSAISEMDEQATKELTDFIEKLHACARRRDDIQIFDVDYVACPLDADGVPIQLGDYLESDEYGGKQFPCRGLNVEVCTSGKRWTVCMSYDSYSGTSEYTSANRCHHVKPPTVENFDANTLQHKKPNPVEEILAEHRRKALSLHDNYLGDFSLSFNDYSKQLDELDAKYAQKLMRISELCTAMDILLKGDNDD